MTCSRSQKGESAAFRHCRLSEKFSQDKLARSCFLKQRHPVDVNWLSREIFTTTASARVNVVTRGNNSRSLDPDKCKTWIQMPLPTAASESEVWSAGNGCSVLVSLGFGKTIFVGASAKHGWENCRTTTWETCKWRDRCIHVLLSAWRHYWKGFLNHRRGRDVFFSHQDTHENWRTTVAGTGTPWDMAEGLVYLPHFWNWLWGVMFTSFFQASLAYSNSN